MSRLTPPTVQVFGLDLGATTTKAVALREGSVVGSATIGARDPAGSAREALKRLLSTALADPGKVLSVGVTGARAAALPADALPFTVQRIDEFRAIGTGGLHLSGLEAALVVSMGTGTAFVAAARGAFRHLGGTALGGGTLRGLAPAPPLLISPWGLSTWWCRISV